MKNDHDINSVLIQEINFQVKIANELMNESITDESHEKILNAFHVMNGSARFLSNKSFVQHLNVLEHFVLVTFQKKIKIDEDTVDILREGLIYITNFLNNDSQDSVIDFSVFENKLNLLSMIKDVPEIEKLQLIENSENKAFNEVNVDAKDSKVDHEINVNSTSISLENNEQKKNEIIDSVVKVNISLLDKLMDLVGELVVNRNQMQQLSNELKHPTFLKLSNDLNTITTDLQSNIMITRMQPVGIVLSKFERLVRDLSNKQKKKISFKIIGQDTELDKSLLEAIKDPMTHLLRNAIDHGVETPEVRVSKGKSEIGSLQVRAYHEGGMVNIVISDDGKGIDHQRIIAKAIEKKIITTEESKLLSVKEAIKLIFAPGFSTAEVISDISGRGVGMDVVKTNIEKIGGSVEIETEIDKGSQFILKIPLTLAIIPALVFEVGGLYLSVPQVNLLEFILVKEDEIQQKIQVIQGERFLRLREKVIPLFDTKQDLDIEVISTIIERKQEFESKYKNIVILQSEGIEFSILVDRITNFEEVVVKPLCPALKKMEIFSGATILGNGSMSLILDTSSFVKRHQITKRVEVEKIDVPIKNYEDFELEYLVFKLFDQVKYCVPLSIVNRLEDFAIAEVEKSESHYLVNYRGNAMPLVHLSNEVENKSADLIEDHVRNKKNRIRVLIVSYFSHYVGIVVDEILAACKSSSIVDEFSTEKPEVAGTINFNNKSITLINLKYILSKKFNHQNTSLEPLNITNIGTQLLFTENKTKGMMLKEIMEFDGHKVMAFSDLKLLATFFEKNHQNIMGILIDPIVKKDIKILETIQTLLEIKSLKLIALTDTESSFDYENNDVCQFASISLNWQQSNFLEQLKIVLEQASETSILQNELDLKNQYCGVRIHNEYFAISLSNIQEVIRPQNIHHVPLVEGAIKGIVNLRGQIIPFLSMGEILKFSTSSNSKVNLIVRSNDFVATISADEIFEIFECFSSELGEVPENIISDKRMFLKSVIKKNNKLISVLDMDKILQTSIS